MTDTRCHPCLAIGPHCEQVGCVNCDAVAAQAAAGAYNIYTASQGWNSGANSITTLDGNLRTVFTVDSTGAIIIGFKATRENPTTPTAILHGLLMRSQAGRMYVSVIERGEEKTSPVPRAAADEFQIRRINGNVSYWQNGARFYTSNRLSYNALIVNACLYMSGDSVQ